MYVYEPFPLLLNFKGRRKLRCALTEAGSNRIMKERLDPGLKVGVNALLHVCHSFDLERVVVIQFAQKDDVPVRVIII